MRKISLVFLALFLVLFLGLTFPVQALPSQARPTQAFTPQKPSKPELLQQREKRLVKIKAAFDRVTSHLQAVVERFDNIISRLESRIEKLDSQKYQVDQAKEFSEQAKTQNQETKNLIAALQTALNSPDQENHPRQAVQAAKEQIRPVKDSLKTTRRLLSQAIASIKAGQADPSNRSQEKEENNNE